MLAPSHRAYDATKRDQRERRMRAGIVVLIGLTLCAQDAVGEAYPDRPIRLISPNPAGGANDTIVRIPPAPTAAEDQQLMHTTGRKLAESYLAHPPLLNGR